MTIADTIQQLRDEQVRRPGIDLDPAGVRALRVGVQARARAGEAAPLRTRSKQRRRGRVAALGSMSVAAAIAIVVIIAVAPWSSSSTSERISPASAAAQALTVAGNAAGAAPWAPLRSGEYAYTHSLPYMVPTSPEMPFSLASDVRPRRLGGSEELWLDRRGHGRSIVLNATGLRDKETATGARRDPNMVNTWDFPSDGTPSYQSQWENKKGALRRVFRGIDSAPDRARMEEGGGRTAMYWGADLASIDALPAEAGPVLDLMVRRLVRETSVTHGMNIVPTLVNGQTAATMAHERHVEAAMSLLSRAPLPPAARHSLFDYLSTLPDAQVDRGATDLLGRSGIEVTFSSRYDRHVAARTVTDADLVEEARAAGAVNVRVALTGETYAIAAHLDLRLWHAMVMFDPNTGEVLQTETMAEASTPVAMPQLEPNRDRLGGPITEITSSAGVGGSQAGGGYVWVKRGRTSDLRSQEPFCREHREVC
ncbi:MAG: hypothetical protein H7287_11420 [Thermoleophilia bacterium]|nr:hypothetical protein [Thermoleophilia bacterium]